LSIRKKKDTPISILFGEFFEKQMERDYINYEIGNSKKYLKPLILLLGFLYFLFIIPDFIILSDMSTKIMVLINRTILTSLIILLYFKLKRAKSYEFFYRWVPFYEVLLFVSFLLTLIRYETPNLLIQTFGIMLIIISIFLIPNRWIYTVIISLVFIIIFYVLSAFLENALHMRERPASLVFLLIVLVLSAISALRTNYYKRLQFFQQNELLEISKTDFLTGCYNRVVSNKELDNLYSENNDTAETSIILFDFDNFKEINDRYGHITGDMILVKTVELFNSLLRGNDIFIRWGGEEFVIFLKGCGISDAVALAESLKETLNNYDFGIDINVTCSFGVVSSLECTDSDELIAKVDNRMYMAKNLGKNRIVSED